MRVVIFVTCADKKQARRIAQGLIKARLAACVNIVDKIESLFWWQGKVDCAKEVLLVIKSRRQKVAAIISKVKSLHSYDCPEIIALPIVAGSPSYLRWIDESVR
jgi:periplasmic divalent cation tolerance protein